MSLLNTSLILEIAPLPLTFEGNPNDLVQAIAQRAKIVSPNGANFIFIGDIAPTTNVGPWLKGGTQWYVWDNTTSQYVPQDISASLTIPYFIGNATPAGNSPPLWLQTTTNATDQNPNGFGAPISWYFWNGSAWVPFNSIIFSGPTANRPANPTPYQEYYDTDISVRIWWERNAWRTVDGVPGDVKFTLNLTAAQALVQNPGWAILGDNNTNYRGVTLSAATQDAGQNPQYVQTPVSGVTPRAAGSTYGIDQQSLVQRNPSSTLSMPYQLALFALYKL